MSEENKKNTTRNNEEEESSYLDKYNAATGMPFNLNQSNELFDETAAAQKHTLLAIRRISLPKGGENWEICENDRVVILIPGARLTNKEKNILKTVDGIKFILNEFKLGNKSVAKIKNKLRNYRSKK